MKIVGISILEILTRRALKNWKPEVSAEELAYDTLVQFTRELNEIIKKFPQLREPITFWKEEIKNLAENIREAPKPGIRLDESEKEDFKNSFEAHRVLSGKR